MEVVTIVQWMTVVAVDFAWINPSLEVEAH